MVEDRNHEHLQLIRRILAAHESAGIKVWLLGGWGIDALYGSIRRSHHDIDLILRLADRPIHQEVMGSMADGTPEDVPQKLRSLLDGIQCDTRYFGVLPDGKLVSDLDADDPLVYPWPPDSFPEPINGELSGIPVRAISWSAQYVAKAGFAAFQKGVPLRARDRIDLALIESQLPEPVLRGLRSWFPGIPKTCAKAPNSC
jgi:hypothetical protein